MSHFRISVSLLVAAASLGSTGCHSHDDNPIGKPITISVPLGLPPLSVPKDNPVTAESIALGRKLFYDTRLSRDNTVSCGSCHEPNKDFTDGHAVSSGAGGTLGLRNAPTVLNAAYLPVQFWDGRAASLEDQSGSPMQNALEMDQNHMLTVFRINADPEYRILAQNTFGSPTLNLTRVEKAIASFERTLLSGDSPFDRYQYGGDKSALSPSQIRGLAVFQDPARGNCATCHTIGDHSAIFTDGKFHNIGVGVNDEGVIVDKGRFDLTGNPSDMGAFRTPTLRNVALTPPYMHDGSEKTLKEVIDFYAGKGNSNPNLDPEMQKIHLSDQDRKDLVEFLKSLTGTKPQHAGPPPSPRSAVNQ
jgi:cytochrome c peroxidase